MRMTIPELRQALRPHLSEDFFQPCPVRVFYLVAAYVTALLHFYLTFRYLSGTLPLSIWLVSLFVAGNVETFFFFFMHEVLHGGVFKNKIVIVVSSFLGGIPFLCSPYVWRAWHVHHHRHTAERTDTDRPFHPDFDGGQTLLGWFHDFAKRLRYFRLQSYFVPAFVISGHHLLVLGQSLVSKGPLRLKHKQATFETLLVYGLFFLPLFFLDLSLSLLGIYLPLLIAHLICNLYILTNHFDNPLNEVNYPLLNSTSVFLFPGLRWTHMAFGRHVEHHIYPHLPHNKLAEVTNLLRRQYPEFFQERQIFSVLHSIYTRRTQAEPIRESS